MSKHAASRLHLVVAAAVAVVATSCVHAASATSCSADPSAASGPHGFYCVALSRASSHSFCLRPGSANPRHVRQLPAYDTLLTESFVRIDNVAKPASPDPCTGVALPAGADIARDDIVRIVKLKGEYRMQIWSSNGARKFPEPVKLTPGRNGPAGEKLYLTTRQLGVDYFVMLADADEGQPGAADVARIEKYYDIEVFPVPDPNHPTACDASRPDHVSGGKTANFKRWHTGDASCSRQHTQEAGSGSGGGNYP